MSEEEEQKANLAIVQEHVDKLGEHFDTVQIYVTRYESHKEGGTVNINLGTGNWFTRFGQVKEWAVRVDEDTRVNRRKDEL